MNKKNKGILITLGVLILIVTAIIFILLGQEVSENENNQIAENNENDISSIVECLKDSGVIIYGSATCPACAQLVNEYGGSEVIEPIYVECTIESQRCNEEMLVNYVPAVQINGELFDGWGSPENLAQFTNCEL